MQPHTRALVAAAVHAFVARRKVAGLYDHAARRHLRIAAEARGEHLQGYDGDRDVRFVGTLPELVDAGDGTSVHLTITRADARGYDRAGSAHFTAKTANGLVQLYDHAEGAWFSFGVQVA